MSWDDLTGWDAVTVRPISSWPGAAIGEGRRSPFDTTWSGTTSLLAHELRMLDARQVVLELAIEEEDIRRDGKPRARAVAAHPGVVLSFQSKHGPLRYATAEFDRWQDNVRAVALALEALRKVDRYGISKRGEQYVGWKQLTAGGPSAARGRALIERYGGLRQAMFETHPDHGGDAGDFADVQAARDEGAE